MLQSLHPRRGIKQTSATQHGRAAQALQRSRDQQQDLHCGMAIDRSRGLHEGEVRLDSAQASQVIDEVHKDESPEHGGT